jgi:hypothetical protein
VKWNYMHHPGCGKPAFRLKRLPVAGEIVRVESLETLTGAEITPHEQIVCGTCGGDIVTPWGGLTLTNVEAEDDSEAARQ